MSDVVIPVDDTELWSAVFGSGWENHEWWRSAEYLNDSEWDNPGRIRVKIIDPDNESKTIQRTLTIDDIVRGLTIAVNKSYSDACTGRQAWLNVDPDFDMCEGDCILQCAIFGEVIYG